jgi:hypothetical protein
VFAKNKKNLNEIFPNDYPLKFISAKCFKSCPEAAVTSLPPQDLDLSQLLPQRVLIF